MNSALPVWQARDGRRAASMLIVAALAAVSSPSLLGRRADLRRGVLRAIPSVGAVWMVGGISSTALTGIRGTSLALVAVEASAPP